MDTKLDSEPGGGWAVLIATIGYSAVAVGAGALLWSSRNALSALLSNPRAVLSTTITVDSALVPALFGFLGAVAVVLSLWSVASLVLTELLIALSAGRQLTSRSLSLVVRASSPLVRPLVRRRLATAALSVTLLTGGVPAFAAPPSTIPDDLGWVSQTQVSKVVEGAAGATHAPKATQPAATESQPSGAKTAPSGATPSHGGAQKSSPTPSHKGVPKSSPAPSHEGSSQASRTPAGARQKSPAHSHAGTHKTSPKPAASTPSHAYTGASSTTNPGTSAAPQEKPNTSHPASRQPGVQTSASQSASSEPGGSPASASPTETGSAETEPATSAHPGPGAQGTSPTSTPKQRAASRTDATKGRIPADLGLGVASSKNETQPKGDELTGEIESILAQAIEIAKEASESGTYVVRDGDSLWSIAARHTGSTDPAVISDAWNQIYQLNKESIGDSPDVIYPGMTLNLPKEAN